MRDFTLAFIQISLGKTKLTVDRQLACGPRPVMPSRPVGCKPRWFGIWKMSFDVPSIASHRAVAVQDVLNIGEPVILLRTVVQRIAAAVRRFNSRASWCCSRRDEVVERSRRSAIVDARLNFIVAAAIDRNVTARLHHAGLRRDVDDAGGAQSILGGQCTSDELQRADQTRIERLSEDRNAFRNDDAVEAVLQAVVLAAHMQLSERILRHARRLKHDLIEQIVVAARLGVDRFGTDRVGRRAELRLDSQTCGIELGGRDCDGFYAVGACR